MIEDRSQLLSLCIPTYNRAERLNLTLAKWTELLRPYNIKIFISDNASTDDTARVAAEWKNKYPNIVYHRNEDNIGPDKNFEKVLTIADTEYRWLMGDDDYAYGDFDGLLKILEQNYDAVFINFDGIIKRPTSEKYIDMNKLMFDHGSATTYLSSLIFNKRLVENKVFSETFNSEYAKLNFAHSAALFRCLAKEGSEVYFFADIHIHSLETNGIVRWSHKAFQFFVNDLSRTAELLPEFYTSESKRAYVYKIRTHFWGIKLYMYYALCAKFAGKFSLSYFIKSHKNIKTVFNFPQRFILFHVALYPKFVVRFAHFMMVKVYRFFKYTIRGKKRGTPPRIGD